MKLRQQGVPFIVSMALHLVILGVLFQLVVAMPREQELDALETVLSEDRIIEEFVQELDDQQEAAETVNFVAGGNVAAVVGAAQNPTTAAAVNIETSELIENPELRVNTAPTTRPGDADLAVDLGEGEVIGEVGAIVDGYGAALDRLVQELMRMMRTDKLLVVWMFDESESMKDDQEEIRGRLERVYEELRLVETDERAIGKKAKLQEILLTAITSFGGAVHEQTTQPTGDPKALMEAIDRVPVDETGAENTCAALIQVLNKYAPMAARQDRKLVIVVVSDESGDDGEMVEEVLDRVRKMGGKKGAPIYVLGRESVFGSLYAHVRWKQPETGRLFYLPIRRGPETPYAEQLQWDGYRRRRDSHMSGFGPYEQVRLCRNSGGIFFQLPGEQENLNDLDDRKNNMLNLREYLPDLSSRRDYVLQRDSSEFRKAIWDVIVLLNPYNPRASKVLELPDPTLDHERFSTNPGEYGPAVAKRMQQIVQILQVVDQAQAYLEKVRPLRDREPSPRWRANYDLITAQLWWYKLRLFEYGLALDQFVRKDLPERLANNPKHNRWYLRENPTGELILPDERQQNLLGVTGEDLQQAHDKAMELFREIQEMHPESPWARRAEYEMERKFGISFHTYYQPPPKPNPNPKPRPKPTPPPKL